MTNKHGIYIDIVLGQEPGGNEVFVEIEDNSGKSVRIGERITRPDGSQAIRIRDTDIGDLYV